MDTPFTIVMYRTFHAQRNAIRPGMDDIGLSPRQHKILQYLLWHRLCLETENHALQGFDDEERAKFREYLNRMYGNLTGKSLN